MKNSFILLPILLVFFVCKCGAQSVADWENLKSDYAAYLQNPSVENVNKVCAGITGITEKRKIATPRPESKKSPNEISWYDSPEDKAYGKTVDYIADNFNLLKQKVKKGDRPSIRLVFRLRGIRDAGEFGEDLDILLDSLIHTNPQLFLEELRECRMWVNNLDDLISFLGAQFADEEGQPQKEYQSRIKDLQKVRMPELITLRDECIKILKDEIRQAN